MIAAIHSAADEDGDGFLNHREFGRIQKRLGHEAPNRLRWMQICAVLSCDVRTGIPADALARLYEMSGAVPDADYGALFGKQNHAVASENMDYDPVAEAKAEHEANQRPKQPKKQPRRSRKARTARNIKSTYGNKATVEITASADLYRTSDNMAFAVHKRSVEQGNMLRVLQDAAVASEQSGQAEKAKLIEQACAYVKQEADAVKQAAFTAAYEKLHAQAVEKQKVQAQQKAKAEKERQERLQREEERVRARERQKVLMQEEKEAKKAERQSVARALKKNALLLEEQQKAKEDEARSARSVARSQRNRGRSKLLKKNDAERQEMLEARRKQRALEKAQVEKERQKEKERLKAAQERNQIELLERALEKAKLEALRKAEIEAMREAKQAIARMAKDGRFDPAVTDVEEHITEEADLEADSEQRQKHQLQTKTVQFHDLEPEVSVLAPPQLAPINRVAVSTSDFPALVVPSGGDDLGDGPGKGTFEGSTSPEESEEIEEVVTPDAVITNAADAGSSEAPGEAHSGGVSQVEAEYQAQPQETDQVASSVAQAEHEAQQESALATPSSSSEQRHTPNGFNSQNGRLKTPWKRAKKRNPWDKKRTRNFAPDVLAAARVELDATTSGAESAGAAQPGQTTGGFGMRRGTKKTPHERRMHHAEQVAAMVKQAQSQHRAVTQAS
eukprot:COSAG02_NODE_123_length_35269_cov_51.697526_28_plen_676_part_00